MSPNRIHAGEPFVVQVSGNLAGHLNQPTGISGLKEQDFSDVTVEFHGMTPRGQSSHRVSVQDDGSFAVSSEFSLEAPGEYDINVSVSNLLSSLSSSLHVVISPPSIDSFGDLCISWPPRRPLLAVGLHGGP
ncbi:polycystic kidney disease 1 like 1-like [Sphaeramia orbicularis]|uniref:polycystic kidney disease 1 like 1-like n=1 Tax=Sphaeramia orbicularis TaxID=375764 RepID=UPI00117E8007|nr:polycystic kidney disease 1 like 1-like [Sphaeramia orbicularis]